MKPHPNNQRTIQMDGNTEKIDKFCSLFKEYYLNHESKDHFPWVVQVIGDAPGGYYYKLDETIERLEKAIKKQNEKK